MLLKQKIPQKRGNLIENLGKAKVIYNFFCDCVVNKFITGVLAKAFNPL